MVGRGVCARLCVSMGGVHGWWVGGMDDWVAGWLSILQRWVNGRQWVGGVGLVSSHFN